jgi:hypothetical protein
VERGRKKESKTPDAAPVLCRQTTRGFLVFSLLSSSPTVLRNRGLNITVVHLSTTVTTIRGRVAQALHKVRILDRLYASPPIKAEIFFFFHGPCAARQLQLKAILYLLKGSKKKKEE